MIFRHSDLSCSPFIHSLRIPHSFIQTTNNDTSILNDRLCLCAIDALRSYNRNYYPTPTTEHRHKKDQIEGYFLFPMSPPTHRVLAHFGTRGYTIFPPLSNCSLGMSVGFVPDSAPFLLLLYSPPLADPPALISSTTTISDPGTDHLDPYPCTLFPGAPLA